MKVVILAGGFGARLSEETQAMPKPMVEIGGKPILWHIMEIYSTYGYNDFIICLGYKGDIIKEYFSKYYIYNNDMTVNLKDNKITLHNKNHPEEWNITLVNTGLSTATGGRIKKIEKYLNNETFMLTYGDGVSNVNIKELIEFHKKHKKLATLTAVHPEGRFGALQLEGDKVVNFAEKRDNELAWINGGFFVLEPKIIEYIIGDETMWEKEPLEKLSKEGQLMAYMHHGFWKCMDKLYDKLELEKMWNSGKAPWKIWND